MLRDLYSKGLNITEIASQTGFDKKTIRRYLTMNTLPEPQKHPERKSVTIHVLEDFPVYFLIFSKTFLL